MRRGRAPISAATYRRASATASRAFLPTPWIEEGLPNAPARCGADLQPGDFAQERLIDAKARDFAQVGDVGKLVGVPTPPCLRSHRGAATHVALDGTRDDVVGDPGAKGHGTARGPHLDQVPGVDAAGPGVGGVHLHRGLGVVAAEPLDAVVLGLEVGLWLGAGVEH